MKKFISKIKRMLRTPRLGIIRPKDVGLALALEAQQRTSLSPTDNLLAMYLEYRHQVNLNK